MSKSHMICVGGPMHGQRKQVERGRSWFETVEMPPLTAADFDPSAMAEEIAYKRHLYEREIIGTGEKAITFWRHSEMPVGQVVYYLLNDLADNEPHTRIAALEWALKQVRNVAVHRGDYKRFMDEREKADQILKIVNAALRPVSTQPVDEISEA